MRISKILLFIFITLFTANVPFSNVSAKNILPDIKEQSEEMADVLAAHKALYDIKLVATRSGAQIVNVSGKMYYEIKPDCEAWITDHRFNLFYEYADSPSTNVTSDFSTFERYDGKNFSFSARRKRDQTLYEELRGRASITEQEEGIADFNVPDDLEFQLAQGTIFPMSHTVEMVRHALENKSFFTSVVFDGSDDQGPVEINTFIGEAVNPLQAIEPSTDLDMGLLNNKAWKVRMAVFPTISEEEALSDYEMDAIFHENGVISNMLIDYDNFSVQQQLVALERIPASKCEK